MFRRHPGMNKQVLVSLFSGNGITGVLTKKVGPLYILRACTVLEPGSEPAPADGEVVIDQANVDFIQIL